ncbi:MAG: hypothetical protein EBR82_76560 [Caulobacteraceae bacterium]|nr:hypothetical protein [Caulobacteraceae bacterium]
MLQLLSVELATRQRHLNLIVEALRHWHRFAICQQLAQSMKQQAAALQVLNLHHVLTLQRPWGRYTVQVKIVAV